MYFFPFRAPASSAHFSVNRKECNWGLICQAVLDSKQEMILGTPLSCGAPLMSVETGKEVVAPVYKHQPGNAWSLQKLEASRMLL